MPPLWQLLEMCFTELTWSDRDAPFAEAPAVEPGLGDDADSALPVILTS